MEFSTPTALHKIRTASHKKVLVDGHQTCPLQAMSIAFNFHTLDIIENTDSIEVTGLKPVQRNEKYLIK